MKLPDEDECRIRLRSELLAELEQERHEMGASGDYLFGEPRLERFLQGNNDSVSDAAAHFRTMLQWRDEAGMESRRKRLDGVSWPGVDSLPELAELYTCMAADVSSQTPDNHLIWLQCDGLAQLDKLMDMSDEHLYDVFFLLFEMRQTFIDELSEKHGRLIKLVQMRDLAGISISKVVANRAAMRRIKGILKIVNTAYPESAHKVLLWNVPKGFNLLWAALQPLFNARIRSKFHFVSQENYLEDLLRWLGIDGLENVARARRRFRKTITQDIQGGVAIELLAGTTEYDCHRLRCGDMVSWSFDIEPRNAVKSLHFRVHFISQGSAPSPFCIREVKVDTTAAGHSRGTFEVDCPGLIWFEWSNVGTWAPKIQLQQFRVDVSAIASANGNTPLHKRAALTSQIQQQQHDGSQQCFGNCFAGFTWRRPPKGLACKSKIEPDRQKTSGITKGVSFYDQSSAGGSRHVLGSWVRFIVIMTMVVLFITWLRHVPAEQH